ncbi:unnamed protein product, partial [marine sediment metagenome]
WTAFTIEITDSYGNRTSDADSVTVSSSVALGGTTTQAASAGLATFDDITCDTAGAITLTGSVADVTVTDTPASDAVTVSADAASYFKVTGDAAMTAGGSNTITITAYDQYDNVAAGYSGDKTLTFSGASSSADPVTSPTCSDKVPADIDFSSDTVVAFEGGAGTSTMKLYKAEEAHIKAADGTIVTSDTDDLDVTVSAGTKNKLLWVTQPATPVGAGAIWTAFTIEITDSYGNRTSDADSVTVSSSVALGGTTTRAASAGLATFDDITCDT